MNLDQILNQKTINRYRDYFKPSQLEGSQPSTNPLKYSSSRIGSYLKKGQKIAVVDQKLLSQNVSVGNIDKKSHNSHSNEKQQQTDINISKNTTHDLTLLENSKPTLAHQSDSVNPTKTVKTDPTEKPASPDSNNFNTNEPSISLDKSSHNSDSFFSSNLDRNIGNYHINWQSIVSIYES